MENTTRPPVVVGVDDSRSALRAVRWAAEEAVRRRLPLRLVHMYPTPVVLHGGIVDPAVIHNALRVQGRRWLAEARSAVAEVSAELRPVTVLSSAAVVPALVEESRDASLLVLGTRGLGGFTGLVIGSTAVLLGGRAHCPLVVVRGDEDDSVPTYGPVVVGVDGATSEAAVAFAFAEASLYGADLVAVHTWADSLTDTVLLGHPDAPDFEPAQQRAYETLGERLAGWQEKYPDVHVTREVVRDHPSRAFVAAGRERATGGRRHPGPRRVPRPAARLHQPTPPAPRAVPGGSRADHCGRVGPP